MSSSRRGVIADALTAARDVQPSLPTGQLGVPESEVWRALRGARAETTPKPGRHGHPEDDLLEPRR